MDRSHLIGIFWLALLMVVHEAGHFLVARAFGMRVIRFSIGFGPPLFKVLPQDGYYWFTTAGERIRLRLWRHDPEKHGPTIYQVALIPFLAYVQIAGMNPLDEVDPNDKGSYANASLPARILAIFAGPLANYLFASVFFFFSFFYGGRPAYPKPGEPLPAEVSVLSYEDHPAAKAGIQTGDRVVEVAQTPVTEWKQMAEQISKHGNEAIPVVVERNGQRVTLTITPQPDGSGKGRIGVTPFEHRVPVTTKEAMVLAIEAPPVVVKNVVLSIGEAITGKAKVELSGPVGIVKETAKYVRVGWPELLSFLGALSAYLGAFNLFPIPALDGGRLLFLAYEATTRRRANAHIEARIHFVGLLMMLGLVLYITVARDIGLHVK